MKATLVLALAALGGLLLLSACSDDDNATGSPSPTESRQLTQSGTGTPTPTPRGTYSDDRFGYTVALPEGWRSATVFMDAYGELQARPQGVGNSEDYAVLTDLSTDDETEFVQRVASETPTGLTGIEPWLEFFFLRTVEIYPTDSTREELLNSATQGSVKHVVTDVRDVELADGKAGTRYNLELDSDYGHFIYDTVYVPSEVNGCSDCTGFVLQTVIAGRALQSPGPTEPPPAEYPKVEFEQIVSSFSAARDPAVERPGSEIAAWSGEDAWTLFSSSNGFTIQRPSDWKQSDVAQGADYLWVAWFDRVAQTVPAERGSLNKGAQIELQELRKVPAIDSAAELADRTTESNAAGPSPDKIIIEGSGSLTVAGLPEYFVDFSELTDGDDVRVTTVTWSKGGLTYFLTLSVFNPGVSDSSEVRQLRDIVKQMALSFADDSTPPAAIHQLDYQYLTTPAFIRLNVQQGWYYHPDVGGGLHCAIDFIDTAINTPATAFPVLASADGWATNVNPGQWNDRLGTFVRIRHVVSGATRYTIYAHLASSNLPPDTEVFVSRGQQIGIAGTTGDANGYRHLHFQLDTVQSSACSSQNTTRIDPYAIYDDRDAYPSPCGAGYSWLTCPPSVAWQPPAAWQDWGTLWGGGEPATASAVDMSQLDHTALLRINPSNSHLEFRYWNHLTGWGSGWTDISGGMTFTGKIGITNHYGEVDVVAVASTGDLYFRKRTTGGIWMGWENKGRPSGGFNGPVAVSGAPNKIGIVGIASGTVYFKKYNGSWDANWTALPAAGGYVYGGGIAITVRSNGLYHVVTFNTSSHVVWMNCSANGSTWWSSWQSIGSPFTDSLGIDNDAATSCGSGSYPGVVVFSFWNLDGYVRCWDAWCSGWENIAGAVGGPAAISNPVNPYSTPPNVRWIDVVPRTGNDVMHRYRAY